MGSRVAIGIYGASSATIRCYLTFLTNLVVFFQESHNALQIRQLRSKNLLSLRDVPNFLLDLSLEESEVHVHILIPMNSCTARANSLSLTPGSYR
jgi:hypothetical protein